MKKKVALIFGITGQDGSYLANFLIKKDPITLSKSATNSPKTLVSSPIMLVCTVATP